MGLKIALVSPYDFPYPGGVTEHIVALAQGLGQRGHEVHILAATSGYQQPSMPNTWAVTRHVTVVPFGGAKARVGLSPLSYWRIKTIFQRERFDVIHIQEPLTPSITWPALMQAPTLAETVTIGTFHAYHERPNWFYYHSRPIFARFFARLNGLIAVSKAAYEFAYRMFPGRYHIIPNGVDLRRFGAVKSSQPDWSAKITLLFVGRLDKRKGFATLLQAFIQLKPRYPQLHLQVVGPFGVKEWAVYNRIAQAWGVTDIEVVGYVTPERLPAVYRQADIFCAPSLGFESFGIVLLEAMAAGLPVVASDIAGYRTLITSGQEGLLVAPGQVDALAAALQYLMEQPVQRRKIAERGRQKAGQYSWEAIVDQTLTVYRETLYQKLPAKFSYPIESVHNVQYWP